MDAREVVELVKGAFRTRAAEASAAGWTDAAVGRDFVAVLHTGRVREVDSRCVVASVADTPDGRVWGYVAAEALESVRQELGDAGIERVSATSFSLMW